MKNLLKIAALSSITFLLASCGSANDVYGNNNPNNYPNNGVYRTSDGSVYRRGEVYRDRNGNVYQNGRIIRNGDYGGQTVVLGRNAPKKLPPGQAKKIYGGNAKDYAPGQMKKRNGYWEKDHHPKKDHHKKGPKKGKRR